MEEGKSDKIGRKSIFLSLWCDDYEPNYSKHNRGSVWMMTLTIQSSQCKNPSIHNVYPIAVAPKNTDGDDHSKFIQIIVDDVKSLRDTTRPKCTTEKHPKWKTYQPIW